MNYEKGQIYRETKWLIFKVSELKPKTVVMHVVSKSRTGQILGEISWFGRWRQYSFDPEPSTTFNNGCLQDIAGVLSDLNKAQKTAK